MSTEKLDLLKSLKVGLRKMADLLPEADKPTPISLEEFKKREKFGESTLVDGSVVTWDGELEQGNTLFIQTESGLLPAPAGEHELADGTRVVIEGDEGLISEVTAPGETPSENPETAPSETDMEQVNKIVSDFENRIKSLVVKFEEAVKLSEEKDKKVSELESKIESFTGAQKEITDVLTKLADLPSEERTKVKFKTNVKDESRFNKMAEIIRNSQIIKN